MLLMTFCVSAQTVNIEGDPYGGNPYATINDAISDSNDGDVILISGIFTESVTFGKSITLRGTDPTTDIIQAADAPASDGSGSSAINVIRAEDEDVLTVSIENLGVRNGNSPDNGGGINVDKVTGLITLSNLIIEDNYSGSNGGGLAVAGSNALIFNCTIQNNSSALDGGGVIFAPNNGTSIDSSIEINQSLLHNNLGRNGGAIYINGNPGFGNDNRINVDIVNSTISENSSFSPAGGNGGGAIWTRSVNWLGDASPSPNVSLRLIHATIYNNSHASSVKNGLQFGAPNDNVAADFSAFNSIIVTADLPGQKALNFNNTNTSNVVNCILGGLENAGPFLTIIDDENNNNEKGRTATFAGITTGLTDQGGSTQVLAIDENSNSVDFCTSDTGLTLPTVDQRNYNRVGIPDAGAFEFDGVLSTRNLVAPNFNVYPNPTTNVIHIEGINNTVNNVKIYSITGVLQKQSRNTTINISDLTSGVYIFKITTNDNRAVNQKIIKK